MSQDYPINDWRGWCPPDKFSRLSLLNLGAGFALGGMGGSVTQWHWRGPFLGLALAAIVDVLWAAILTIGFWGIE